MMKILHGFLILNLVVGIVIYTDSSCSAETPVPGNHWSIKDMATLASEGLIPGYAAVDFTFTGDYTREEFARIVGIILDRYKIHGTSYTNENMEIIHRLSDEYEVEMVELGDSREVEIQISDVEVPVVNWSYSVFADFAEKGYLPGLEKRDFLSGRLFTRSEMAEFTKILVFKEKNSPQLFTDENRRDLEYLQVEFYDAPDSPHKPDKSHIPAGPSITKRKKDILAVKGSSNFTYQAASQGKNTLSNRVSLELEGAHFKSYFSGNADNSGVAGSDLEFGHDYVFNINRQMYELHSNLKDPKKDTYLLTGEISNVDFANGTLISASSMKGYFLSTPGRGREKDRIVAFSGEGSDGSKVKLLRLEAMSEKSSVLGFSSLKETTSTGDVLNSISVDLARKKGPSALLMEFAEIQQAGYGVYTEYGRSFGEGDKYKFKTAFRQYRDFILEHNSPQKYIGRSGGSGENEKSFFTGLTVRLLEKSFLLMNRDHAYTLENGRRTNMYYALEHSFSDRWNVAVGQEEETGGIMSEKEKTVNLQHVRPGKTAISSTWKRSVRDTGPSSSTLLNFSTPFLDKGKFIYSYSRRVSSGARVSTSRFRLNMRKGSNILLSVAYNFSRNAPSRFDTNVSWKF